MGLAQVHRIGSELAGGCTNIRFAAGCEYTERASRIPARGCRIPREEFVVQVRAAAGGSSHAVAALGKELAMSKTIAIMSMSLDGYVADVNDGVDEVFDWYSNSGTSRYTLEARTHDVQSVRAEHRTPSRSHRRTWCRAHRCISPKRTPV